MSKTAQMKRDAASEPQTSVDIPLKARLFAYSFYSFFGVAHALPFRVASSIGGTLVTLWGRRTVHHEQMKRRVKAAFPEKSDAEIQRIAEGVWENLGRMFAEFPHVPALALSPKDTEIEGADLYLRPLREGRGCLVLSLHLGNHERVAAAGASLGQPAFIVSKAHANVLVERRINELRENTVRGTILVGSGATQKIREALQQNGAVGVMLDRLDKRGAPATLLGREVFGAKRPIEIALEVGAAVIMLQSVRLPGARARLVFRALPAPDPTLDMATNAERIYASAFQEMDRCIREHPEQFFWMHRNWPE